MFSFGVILTFMEKVKTASLALGYAILVLSAAGCGKNTANTESPPAAITVLSAAETDPYSVSLEGKTLPDKVELFYFYEQSCEVCDELDEFYRILSEHLPHELRDQTPHLIYTINTFSIEGRKTYEKLTGAMGLDRSLLQVPLLVAGGRIFQGNETIANNIREAFLTAAEDLFVNQKFYNPALKKSGPRLFEDYPLNPSHITLVYFYRIVCPYCEEANPVINSLPQTLTLDGRQIPLDIIRINTRSGNNNERVMAFFDHYQVPNEDRKVPIVFLAGTYLSGPEAIGAELLTRLSTPPRINKLAELLQGSSSINGR